MEKSRLRRFEIEAGECLLIGGPAQLKIVEGKIEALGVELSRGGRVVVRVFRAIPIRGLEKSLLEVEHGLNGFIERIDKPYPPEWVQVVDKVLEVKGTVLIVGAVDVGKSTLCTLITNRMLLKGLKVGVIEGDVGQAEIGPPTTVSLAIPKLPSPDLFRQDPMTSEFIGSTSPMGFEEEIIEAIRKLKNEAENLGVDLLVVNTDGWIEDEKAVTYKVKLADTLKPSLVVVLSNEEELEELKRRLSEKFNVIIVPQLSRARKRSREARKELRELSYQKNLRGSTVRSIPISWIRILNHDLGTGVVLSDDRFKKLNEQLNGGLVYGEETPNGLLLVLNGRFVSSKNSIKRVFEGQSRPVSIIWLGSERGLIVGLYNREGKFIGIGVIEEIDYKRRILRIHTPCQQTIGMIKLGCIKLVESWKEVEKYPSCPLKPVKLNEVQ
ncbi:MAG: Clp1/GlmU family protein [Candidatus Bathyarchaeia archaeon]